MIAAPTGEHRARLEPFDYEALTIDGTVKSLTKPPTLVKLAGAVVAFEDGPVRFRVDGVADPSSTEGAEGLHGQRELLNDLEAGQFKATRQGATNGVARVTYYRLR